MKLATGRDQFAGFRGTLIERSTRGELRHLDVALSRIVSTCARIRRVGDGQAKAAITAPRRKLDRLERWIRSDHQRGIAPSRPKSDERSRQPFPQDPGEARTMPTLCRPPPHHTTMNEFGAPTTSAPHIASAVFGASGCSQVPVGRANDKPAAAVSVRLPYTPGRYQNRRPCRAERRIKAMISRRHQLGIEPGCPAVECPMVFGLRASAGRASCLRLSLHG